MLGNLRKLCASEKDRHPCHPQQGARPSSLFALVGRVMFSLALNQPIVAMKSSFDFNGVMPSPLRTIDPARLFARRVEVGLSRAEIAKRAGVSRRMIFFYEEGAHTPTPVRLERLAEAWVC